MMTAFLIWCCVLYFASGSIEEDELEIQIDPRLPRSFQSWEMLSLRNVGFTRIIQDHGDNSFTITPIPNWELYARK